MASLIYRRMRILLDGLRSPCLGLIPPTAPIAESFQMKLNIEKTVVHLLTVAGIHPADLVFDAPILRMKVSRISTSVCTARSSSSLSDGRIWLAAPRS
ncbi:hypothetical protein [Bradyrhizobium yuanmingense]|uniref:hypothetical protein n=1 Tax=Bradyrhizobium yuanmingense TaxID=108015 RepID=UPI0012FD8993|nr:hypothetical protein [Bradyrhizobium yuanmingense]